MDKRKAQRTTAFIVSSQRKYKRIKERRKSSERKILFLDTEFNDIGHPKH